MYKILTSYIEIGDFKFSFVVDLQVTSTYENFTDTAEITLPKKMYYQRGGSELQSVVSGSEAIFKRGDAVSLNVGYNGFTGNVFSGQISKVTPGIPISLTMSDGMEDLKKTPVEKYSRRNTTLTEVLIDLCPIDFVCENLELGNFRASKINFVGILEHMKKNYGMISYVRNNRLIVGFPYLTEQSVRTPNTHEIRFNRDMVDSGDLTYYREEDVKIKLKVVDVFADGTRYEKEVGDDDGEIRTLFLYDVPKAQVETVAEQNIYKYKYEGFQGSFTKFLEPLIEFGDIVRLINDEIPDQNGYYYVKQVDTNFGSGGGRQTIHLDRKAES